MRAHAALLTLGLCAFVGCGAAPHDETEPEAPAPIEPTARRPRRARPAPTIDPDEATRDPLSPPRDVARPPRDASVTDSGLAYRVLTPGNGLARPGLGDTIEAHYTGWTQDGEMFDSSIPRNEPIKFKPEHVIKGWSEVLQLMVEGEKVRVWIPAELAYGETPRRGAPAGQLTFDIELLRINPPN